MPPPLSLSSRWLSIVTSGEEGGGALGGAKILQKIMAPTLSIIKIVKYCGVVGGGGALVALKSYKHNGAPSLSLRLLSIVASGEGGGGLKSYKKIMAPPLSVIMIVKYCGVVGGGGGHCWR